MISRAGVRPVFKNSDPVKPKNYSPGGILNALSKGFEGILCNQIMH